MTLVAVVSDKTVQKIYKTSESLNNLKEFLEVLHPKTIIIPVTATTGFPQIGYEFDGQRFLEREGAHGTLG